jgi:adenylate cyclase
VLSRIAWEAYAVPSTYSRVVERAVALVAVQWRNREQFARTHLAADFVFMSKLWSETVGSVVAGHGGSESEAHGEGSVAVFGLDSSLGDACRSALAAAAGIDEALLHLERQYAREFDAATDFAICVHAGHAAIGRIGMREPRRLFAAGEALDVVRALQAATPQERVVVTAAVARHAGRAHD